jgi:hypothetical protein
MSAKPDERATALRISMDEASATSQSGSEPRAEDDPPLPASRPAASGFKHDRVRADSKQNGAKQEESQPSVLIQRLGLFACLKLSVGLAAIFTAVGFVSFLWFFTRTNSTWRSIALRGWMTRAVTLTALVLRSTISVQAGCLTSMLAGLLLEKSPAVAFQLTRLTMIRSVSHSPNSLAWSQIKISKELQWR